MVSLIGKVIAGWKIQGLVKCTEALSIYKVCHKDNDQIKYCMTILYKDSDNPEFTDNVVADSYLDINVSVRPEFVYYDNHCFPIIPTENACGEYNGHEFFVYERISKPLNNIITKDTHITHDDYVNIACQIFDILEYLFKKNKVLKNLDLSDFCLRRTTNGYRVVLVNQDFYTGSEYEIEDTTFTSISVMNGNEPTMRANVISAVYLILYLVNTSLPWMNSSVEEILAQKMDDELIDSMIPEDYQWCLTLLKKYNLHSTSPISLESVIAQLRASTKTRHITFGTTLSKFCNKRRIPSVTEKDYYSNPVIEKDEELKVDVEEVNKIEETVDAFEKFEEEMEEEEEKEEKEEEMEDIKKIEETVDAFEKFEEEMEEEPEENDAPAVDLSQMALPKVEAVKREQPSDDMPIVTKRSRICDGARKKIKRSPKAFFSSATFSNILMVSAVAVTSMMGV